MTQEEIFHAIDEVSEFNTQKVLQAMQEVRLSDAHFKTTSGYAYDDLARQTLDKLFAKIFKAEDALVRTQFVSGTHALATVLLGILRPNDKLISITGTPYDTMQTIIGYDVKQPVRGSLKDFGILYEELDLKRDGTVDFDLLEKTIDETATMVLIQRSRGYCLRPALSCKDIQKICAAVKQKNSNCICFVDNCYGEFVETVEPIEMGADICAGSLIKNIGGGLAESGGYIVGKKNLVELCSYRLTAPSLGSELGATLANPRTLFQGVFLAPHVTAQALKSACFAAKIFSDLGYPVFPKPDEIRHDIIQAIELGSAKKVCAFCQAIQKWSPVDSFATPEPWDMPGYDDQIIMAAGTFIQGASIELSADAPMREPFAVYLQGGVTLEHAKIAIKKAAQAVQSL